LRAEAAARKADESIHTTPYKAVVAQRPKKGPLLGQEEQAKHSMANN